MPVKKVSDAPPAIQELDDVKLSLAQVNWILRVYDALKEQGKVDSPMAVAIEEFKKSFHVEDGKWIENEKEATLTASRVDLEHLDRYVIVPTGNRDPANVEDLRELEGDFGPAVYALWSDSMQSIVAFAFERSVYTEGQARAWVDKTMEEPVKTSWIEAYMKGFIASARQVFAALRLQPQPVTARSFDETRRLVQQALDARYSPPGPLNTIGALPYIIEIGNSMAIFDWDSKRYSIGYQIADDGTITLDDAPAEVTQGWRRPDGAPVSLHAFSVRLGPVLDAMETDDGLVWKEIIHPGQWFKGDSGNLVEITAKMIRSAFKAWKAGLPRHISVPADYHHDDTAGLVPVEHNRGFVEKLKMIGDKLFAGFRFTDPEIAFGVEHGNIADCSVYLQPDVIHPTTGEKFDWILQHVLLTNDPLVQDLSPFGAVPASSTDGRFVVQSYHPVQAQEVPTMPNEPQTQQTQQPPTPITLSAEDFALYGQYKGLKLSIGDIQAMVAERAKVCQKARDLEITRVVRAMEATEAHPGVVRIEGYRHWPVVIAAVEKALREHPAALALAANDDGQTGLDAIVLAVANAIPQEGRMALAVQPASSKAPVDPSLSEPNATEPTGEQVKEFATRLHPQRGATVAVK